MTTHALVRELSAPGSIEKQLLAKTKKGPICAALIDPENFSPDQSAKIAEKAVKAGASLVLVGGSTLSDQSRLDEVVIAIKNHVSEPVMLFPGNVTGVSKHADAILFSSLLNSTNPYFIVGAQALGSMEVFKSKIESIPMGYLVFGNSSTTSFIAQVNPLPPTKPGLAVIYALAARYLGMRSLYLEAGSGAQEPLPAETIKAVRSYYDGLIFVGGGITNGVTARSATDAGANIIVIGNLLQKAGFERALKQIVDAITA